MAVEYMSFSAHADAKGIMQLISQCEPRNVLLVHGEADKMAFLKTKITQEFGESTIYLFLICFQKKNYRQSIILSSYCICDIVHTEQEKNN